MLEHFEAFNYVSEGSGTMTGGSDSVTLWSEGVVSSGAGSVNPPVSWSDEIGLMSPALPICNTDELVNPSIRKR